MVTAAVLLAVRTMTFPLGVVDIPEGCTAPARVPMLVDGFMESIECEGGFSVNLYGSVYIDGACKGLPPGSKGTQGAPDRFVSKAGIVLPVCVLKLRVGSKQEREETLVDLGSAGFSAEIRTKRDLSLLRQITRSFRRGKSDRAK